MESSNKELSYHEDTELRLGLPGTHKKRSHSDVTKHSTSDSPPPKKVQAIGWPPIRSFRKMSMQAPNRDEEDGRSVYVKVSMDGAPYLRKIDVSLYKGYSELLKAMEDMFKLKAGMLSEKVENGSEYKPTYEDKDGDWMLVGDVPLEMFISSCKRLRIMKGSQPNLVV